MEFQIVISAKKYLKILLKNSFWGRIIEKIIKVAEKYAGAPLFLESPASMQNLNEETFGPLLSAIELKKSGIIKEITKRDKFPDEPFIHNYYVSTHVEKIYGAGVSFKSEKDALWRGIAEATERFLWARSEEHFKRQIVGSFFENRNQALNIFSLAGFSDNQKKERACLHFNEHTKFKWTYAKSLLSSREILCPIQLISPLYSRRKVKCINKIENDEPKLRWPITTGLATGRSVEEALTKSALEIIERDAFMITYLNKLSPPKINLEILSEGNEEIKKIIDLFKRYRLETHLLELPTDFPVHVILSLIIDRTGLGPAISLGASADFNQRTAIIDSLSESLVVRFGMKNNFNEKLKTKLDPKKLDRDGRLTYWVRQEQIPKVSFLLNGSEANIETRSKVNFYEDFEDNEAHRRKKYRLLLKKIISSVKKKNYEFCYSELSPKNIKRLGLHVVYGIMPELQPLHLDESIPYQGGKRLKEVPLIFGYQPAEELNSEPHPFP